MFRDYTQRGAVFAAAVKELAPGEPSGGRQEKQP
jgi:hypothetical protein